jgi:ferredoxin-NADP reductase
LCGDPADAQALEIAVLREEAGRGGSAWIHDHVHVGDRLKIRGPRNHFRLDASVRKLIFIAGGIGITPVSTMARRAKALGMDYELHYSGRSRQSMALLGELTELHGERLHVYVADEGRRNDLAALLARPEPGTKVYACGPERMLQALEQCCTAWPQDTLRIEHFASTMGTLDPAQEHAFEVELKDSGIVLTVPPDRTLLSVLRAANIDIQSDCEEGLCGSCEVRVLAGDVDHRDVVLTRGEREANARMMSCCSRAGGSRLVLEL